MGGPVIPLFLLARLWWTPASWAARARRYPARAVAVLAVAVLAASVAVAVAHPQAQGCRWRVAAVPGQRAHVACVVVRRAG